MSSLLPIPSTAEAQRPTITNFSPASLAHKMHWSAVSAPSLLLLLLSSACCYGSVIPRPDHTEHARLARWLAHYSSWGTLSTQGQDHQPAAGVVSFSDGPLRAAAGRLFFYLTPMDETGHHVQDNPDCALSVSEAQLLPPQGCGSTDPMEPTCARITVLGRMLQVEAADRAMAQAVLFDKHPAMKGWPADHGFKIYELHLREIHMLDWYGGMHIISPDDYFAAKLQPQQQQQRGKSSVPRKVAGAALIKPS